MDAILLIEKFYAGNPVLKDILLKHSRQVMERCLSIAIAHPELNIDVQFVKEAAMLHDIGIIQTDAPGIHCYGTKPYICHGYLGAEMLRAEGLFRHARVCERHTGAGLMSEDIIRQDIPIPVCDYLPETIEEQLICYADKFYSKTHLDKEKTLEKALKSVRKFSDEGAKRFMHWVEIFG